MQQPVSYMDFFFPLNGEQKSASSDKTSQHRASRESSMELPSEEVIIYNRVTRAWRGRKPEHSFIYQMEESVLLSAQSLRNKWAVLKASDPPTKSGDKTVTSCGKQLRQLAGCTGCAKGFITSFPFYLAAPSFLPSGQRGYHINPGWHQALPVFACWKIRLYRLQNHYS